jgi:flavin reductase
MAQRDISRSNTRGTPLTEINDTDALLQRLPVSYEEFRQAMRRFAANVTVITCADGEYLNGMTATAVSGVTADPPSVLIIVNHSARSRAIIKSTGAFTINVLAAHQQAVAIHFASKPVDPFGSIAHTIGSNRCPIIDGIVAHLECAVAEHFEFGTHSIFIGKIVGTNVSRFVPLLFHDGSYQRLGGAADAR